MRYAVKNLKESGFLCYTDRVKKVVAHLINPNQINLYSRSNMANRSLSNPNPIHKSCSVIGCPKKYFGKSFCNMHYVRWRVHGSPDVTERNRGVGSTFEQRFWSRVNKVGSPKGCWEWTAGLTNWGYATVMRKGKKYQGHRMAWFLTFGSMPKLFLLHSCDNRKCVNPSHLREGTKGDNARDRAEHGAQPRGEGHWNAKIDENTVLLIRNLIAKGLSSPEISRQLNVSVNTVKDIKSNKRWRGTI